MIKTVIKIFKPIFLTMLVGCTSVTLLQTNGPITTEIENKSSDENKVEQVIANGPSEVIIDKKYFIIHYDRQYKLAKFVEYKLRAENLKNSFIKRKNRKDPFHSESALLQLGFDSVEIDDYKHSGYDRGHLAPSADFEWSEEANEATFTMANMVPQTPELNRSAWKGLEEEVRKWACVEDEIRIVTGPIFVAKASQLFSGVNVPQSFFKVVLDETPPRKAIGFILNQQDLRSNVYKEKVTPIEEIESISGIKFFEDLPKEEQVQIKAKSNLFDWNGEKCKGINVSNVNITRSITENFDDCSIGKLKSASIRGCCSHHGGVMGPKKNRACCTNSNKVICQDGSISLSCRCYD